MNILKNVGQTINNVSAQVPGLNRAVSYLSKENVQTYYCKDRTTSNKTYNSRSTGIFCKKEEADPEKRKIQKTKASEFKCFNDQPGKTLLKDEKIEFLDYITEFNDKNNNSKCRYIPSKLEI